MDVRLSIGDFSKMTYLSVKALRHYHDVGLLEPAAIDPASGYRLYTPEQVATAQAIRRFRDLDMPIERVRAVLTAPDDATRNRVVLEHLQAMQAQLTRTQDTVASLQALLGETLAPRPVTLVDLPATAAAAICEIVAWDDCGDWCDTAFAELHEALDIAEIAPIGPDSALYPDDFFTDARGPITAYVPVASGASLGPVGRVERLELPAVHAAVLVHEGPAADLDRAYGDLGLWVASRGRGTGGPVREHYLAEDRTEVCWPVTPEP